MSTYGFYRQWNSKLPVGLDLYGHRVCVSAVNSIVYLSPFGLFKLFNLVNRIDIRYYNRDPLKYPNSYEELLGTNYDTL